MFFKLRNKTKNKKGGVTFVYSSDISAIDLIYAFTALNPSGYLDTIAVKNPVYKKGDTTQKEIIPVPLDKLDSVYDSQVFSTWFLSLTWNDVLYVINVKDNQKEPEKSKEYAIATTSPTPEQSVSALLDNLEHIFQSVSVESVEEEYPVEEDEQTSQTPEIPMNAEPYMSYHPIDENGEVIKTGLVSTEEGAATITPEEGSFLTDFYPDKFKGTAIATILGILYILTITGIPFGIGVLLNIGRAKKYKDVSPLRYEFEVRNAKTWAVAGCWAIILTYALIFIVVLLLTSYNTIASKLGL